MLNCMEHIQNLLPSDVISSGSNLPTYSAPFVHVLFLRVACTLLAVTLASWNYYSSFSGYCGSCIVYCCGYGISNYCDFCIIDYCGSILLLVIIVVLLQLLLCLQDLYRVKILLPVREVQGSNLGLQSSYQNGPFS